MTDDNNNLPVPAVPDNLAAVQAEIADYGDRMKDTIRGFTTRRVKRTIWLYLSRKIV